MLNQQHYPVTQIATLLNQLALLLRRRHSRVRCGRFTISDFATTADGIFFRAPDADYRFSISLQGNTFKTWMLFLEKKHADGWRQVTGMTCARGARLTAEGLASWINEPFDPNYID